MDAQTKDFLKGMIVLWSGSIASIPGGWALCNGSNGTPDLRNNFVVGAGDTYAVDATGGAVSHSHSISKGNHMHEIDGGGDISAGSDYAVETQGADTDTNATASDNLPPYFALAYIMKL